MREQEYTLSEYLRMSGIYWGLTVMDLMSQLPRMNRQEIVDFIAACQHECGGVGASIGHDPHLLYTLSAVQVMTHKHTCFPDSAGPLVLSIFFPTPPPPSWQILCLYDSVDALDVDKIVEYVKGLQQADGSFAGDKWGMELE